MKIAIVILNWNTRNFLDKFLPGLLESIKGVSGAEVIVADNASEDGSLELMKEKFPEVRALAFERNYGFTGGYNRAFAEIDSDLFLLLNSDIEVGPGWLEPLVEWMQTHSDCGACAPKLHSWQDRERFEYAGAAGGILDKWGYPLCRGRVMSRTEIDRGQYDTPADVFWATGACLMVRSSVFRELGGLDDRFFAHMEEIDLCWRMQLAGWKITVVPASVVYHVGGGTLPQTSPFKLFLNFRNNLLMIGKNQAATYAVDLYRKGYEPERAAAEGLKRSRRLIALRKVLNVISALVYVLQCRTDYAKAVFRAHNEFDGMYCPPDAEEIAAWLGKKGRDIRINGRYGKWIVLQHILKGKKIFDKISTL